MRRESLLTGIVTLTVFCLPALCCHGQDAPFGEGNENDPFDASVENKATASAPSVPEFVRLSEPASIFHGQPLAKHAVQIDNALRQPVEADYYEQPFGDILDELMATYQFSILIHPSAEDHNLNADSMVTLKLANVPLHSALELMLEKHECTLAIHNDVLQVVSKDAANELMEKRIYDCSQLIESAEARNQHETLLKLQEVITRSIDPGSWEVTGGNGQVSEFAGKLVISQTLNNHLAIERLMDGLYKQVK